MLPELMELDLPDEVLADCARCVMLPRDGEERAPWHFSARSTCCTYHPDLANYLVGRALRRDDTGAERVAMRLNFPAGRDAYGLHPPPRWAQRYRERRATAFGRDESLICPYKEPEAGCTIWRDRNSVCRTWFCSSVEGEPLQRVWGAVRDVLARVEIDLASFCVTLGDPPRPDAPVAAWHAWYRWCADAVDHVQLDQAPGLRSQRLIDLLDLLNTTTARRRAVERPSTPIPSVSSMDPHAGGLRLTGYSAYDGVQAPQSIFAFLGRLDGQTTWQDAAEQAHNEAGLSLEPDFIDRLFAVRILRAADGDDDPYSADATPPWLDEPGR